jgi:hypothetical protein
VGLIKRVGRKKIPDHIIRSLEYMTPSDAPSYRISSQQIGHTNLQTPEEMVRWLGAVQAQEYSGGLWSIGLRLPGLTSEDIEQAIHERKIIRTWPMRGTLHFVPARDARWMLELLAPRVMKRFAGRYRELGLNDEDFTRSRQLFTEELLGGGDRTRDELFRVLADGGISPDGQRGYHILANLGMNGIICFGPPRGKQHTFVLFDEWVRERTTLQRRDALAELARRYITSHGPATQQDFAWWSGLPAADVRAGIDSIRGELTEEQLDGRPCWMASDTRPDPVPDRDAHLLPHYDEYIVAYRDRSAMLDPAHREKIHTLLLTAPYIIGGRVTGTWKRVVGRNEVTVSTIGFRHLNSVEISALSAAVDRYGAFLGLLAVHRHEDGPV